MARGGLRSMAFTPPPEPPRTPGEETPQRKLWVEPEQQMLILGEMIRDVNLMQEKLQALPFSGVGYRGELRMIRGAAQLITERCARLLDEDEKA